jgi:tetratricopeptide (TPR) repeat protein
LKHLWLLLIIVKLTAQIEVLPEGQAAFVQAMAMEQSGNLDGAIQIYNQILNGDPNNQPAYFQLRNIYSKTGDPATGILLIKNWLKNHPEDLQSELTLGEFYFRNQGQEKALEIWRHFRKTKLTNQTTYRLLFHTYIRFGQTEAMESLVRDGRDQFNEPHFLAIDLANYYQSRQTQDRSLREYLTLIRHQKQYLRYATDRILLMSDDSTTHALIDSTLLSASAIIPELKTISAGFYYKTGQFQKALDQHKIMGVNNPGDSKRWLVFSENLMKEKQYELSIRAYHYFLQNMTQNNPSILGKTLLGLGQAYENQIIQNQTELQFVKWYPDNDFFQPIRVKTPNILDDPLANTIEHYQSILVLLPPSQPTATVHFRLGEIQLNFLQDMGGAKISYETALASRPNVDLTKKIRTRMGDLLLSTGQYAKAIEYFNQSSTLNNIDTYTIRYLNSLLFNRNIKQPLAFLDSTIYSMDPNHQFFNDLMEIHDLITHYYSDGTRDDRLAFESFLQGEALVRQFKIQEAIETFNYINQRHPDALITPLSTLRKALLLLEFDQPESALSAALSIENTSLKDRGLALAGEIEELFLGNPKKALKHYHRILSECKSSLLVEPVRLHIRKLSKPQES